MEQRDDKIFLNLLILWIDGDHLEIKAHECLRLFREIYKLFLTKPEKSNLYFIILKLIFEKNK